MNFKSIFSVKTLLIVGSFAVLVACKKNTASEDPTTESTAITTSANDDNTADAAFMDLKEVTDQTGLEATNVKGIDSTKYPCAKITTSVDTVLKTITATIDFGTENCLCKDGKYRKGKIQVKVTGNKNIVGSTVVYTADNFFVNNNGVSGTKTVTIVGEKSFRIVVANGKVTKADGGIVTWNTDRTRTMTAGFETPLDFTDDVFEIAGTSSGINASGNAYKFTTITPLVKAVGCQWIKSGKLKIERAGKLDATVDYGDGTCDDQGTVTVANTTKAITLKHWKL
jgi:hypothetical protein